MRPHSPHAQGTDGCGQCLLSAIALSPVVSDAPKPPLSSVLSAGKILFRRSHVRDVAVKRLKPIDEYCRVRAGGQRAALPRGAHRHQLCGTIL